MLRLSNTTSWFGWRRRSVPCPITFAVDSLTGPPAVCTVLPSRVTITSPMVGRIPSTACVRDAVSADTSCVVSRWVAATLRCPDLASAASVARTAARPGSSGWSRFTGSAGPTLEPGATKATWAAASTSVAAPFASAPEGPTHATTGTFERCTARTIFDVSTSTAPLESSRMISIVAPERLALSTASSTRDAVGGSSNPWTSTTSMPLWPGRAAGAAAPAAASRIPTTAAASTSTVATAGRGGRGGPMAVPMVVEGRSRSLP